MSVAYSRFSRIILTAVVSALILGGGIPAGSAWGDASPVRIRVLTVRKATVPPLAHCHKVAMVLKDEGATMEMDEVLSLGEEPRE